MPQFEIDIIGRFAKFQDSLDTLVRNSEKGAKRLEHAFEGFTKLVTLGFVSHEVKRFAEDVLESALKFEQSQNRVQATLRATGNAAGVTREQIEGFAKELSEKTRFDDSGVRNAAASLLRFRDVQGEVFKDALELIPDVAEGLGVDLPTAAAKFGLALQNPQSGLKGLREVMSKLTDEQQDNIARLVEQGKLYEAQRIIIDQVKASVGGLAQEMNTGLSKATSDMSKAWDDFLKTLANTPTTRDPVVNTLNYISQAFKDLDEDIERLKKAKGAFDTGRAFRDALRPSRARLRVGEDAGSVVEAVTSPEERAKLRADQDKADKGAAEQRARAAQDQAYKEQQRQIRDNVALTKQRVESEAQTQRQAVQQVSEILQDGYDRGLIATRDFYAAKLKIAQDANRSEIAGLDAAIAAQNKVLNAKSTPITEKPQIRAEIERLQSERVRKAREGNFLLVQSDLDLKKAQDALNDSITDSGIKLLEEAGSAGAAARAQRDLITFQQQRLKLVSERGEGSAAVQRFDALQREAELHGDIKDVLKDEANIRQQVANQEQIADNARVAHGGTDAELQFLESQNRIRRDSIPIIQEQINKLEALAALEQPGSRAQKELLVQKSARQAQLEGVSASTGDAAQAARLLNVQEEKTQAILEREQLLERSINAEREAGSITTLDALHRTDAARQNVLGALQRQLAIEEDLAARAPFDDRLQLNVARTKVAIEELAATTDQAGKQMRQIFQDSLVDPLMDFVNHTKTAGEAFNAFAKNIEQALLRIATNDIAENLFKTGTAGSGAGAGAFAGAAGWFANLFKGGGAGAGTVAVVPAMQGATGGIFGPHGEIPLRRYAFGGIVTHPQLALYGEGMHNEAVIPLPNGKSVPVEMKGVRPAGSTQTNVVMHVSTPDAASFKRSEGQIMTSLAIGARRAIQRR